MLHATLGKFVEYIRVGTEKVLQRRLVVTIPYCPDI